MLIRLALAFALAVSGTGISSFVAVPSGWSDVLPGSAGVAGSSPIVLPTVAGSPVAVPVDDVTVDDVTVTELDVVLPPVEPTGAVVDTPQTREAQADPDTIVTDQVVEGVRVESDVVEADQFQTVGVTWPGDVEVGELDARVRTRAEGQWSDWVLLESADDAPDPGTADAANAVRGGTDSVWVGDADAIQLSFAATPQGGPDGLSLALIGSPGTPAAPDATGALASGRAAVTTAAYQTSPVATVAAPRVISRAEWGARPQVCTPDVASTLVGAVVHHTAGSNDYATVAQAEQQIRNDQRYHIESRGWCDIGYNFIVDKWGNIYEGRANSLNAAVIGVHAGGFNTGTVGVSMLGNFDVVGTPAATIDAVGRIIGLRLAAYNVNPDGTMTYYTGGGENSKFQNQNVPLPRVFAHRDVAYTACPGRYGYAQMPTIRAVARTFYDARQFDESQSVVKALYQDLLGRQPDPTGLSGWTAALMQGTSQSVLVGTLTRSDEYIWSRVAKAYREVLGREPEPAGATNWLNAIKAGQATVDDVQRRFYDSGEYFASSGGTPEGYVKRLFTTMLRRQAAASEVSAWVTAYHQHGRAAVVDAIWFSTEAASVRAGDYYQTFLGRGPDPSGQAAWAQVLLIHGEGAVRVGIAGSLEYRGRAIARYP